MNFCLLRLVIYPALATTYWRLSYAVPIPSGSPLALNIAPEGATQKYIVEVKQHANLEAVASLAAGKSLRDVPEYKPFKCGDLFRGFVLDSQTQNFDTLQSIDGVVNAWPLRALPLPPTVQQLASPPLFMPLNYSMHRWTGVDKLHKAGVKGKGVKVAVIDTGVDYTHSALGGCFGSGCKVVGGYDLIGKSFKSPKPELDPMDSHDHGTHVAGILAAQNDWFTGVAPESEILAYKVFASDEEHGVTEKVLMQSFCDAYSAGADVITSSVNMENGSTDGPWALVASRIVDKGVVVTIAAGNLGIVGPFASSGASNGRGVLAVAAVNVTGDNFKSMSDELYQPRAAGFNSWGPTNELLIKPDIAAPGTNVISTFPRNMFKSMAAPYVAGVAALYISKHGGREEFSPGFARYLAKRIISGGRSVAWFDRKSPLNHTAPPFQVGTGLIDAEKVLCHNTVLIFEPIALLDTEQFKPDWTAEIANTGERNVTYSFELEPQAAVDVYNGKSGIAMLQQLRPYKVVPRVTLPKPQLVSPGHKTVVTFSFSLPQGVSDDMLPLYGGKIWIKGDNGEQPCIPYGGAAYDTEKAFDTMFVGNPFIAGQRNNWTWSFDLEKDPDDFVELTVGLSYPCVHLRWDIFQRGWEEPSWYYPPRVGVGGYVGSATTVRDALPFGIVNTRRVNISDTVAFPKTRVPRGFMPYWWFGRLADGTQLKPGTYV